MSGREWKGGEKVNDMKCLMGKEGLAGGKRQGVVLVEQESVSIEVGDAGDPRLMMLACRTRWQDRQPAAHASR